MVLTRQHNGLAQKLYLHGDDTGKYSAWHPLKVIARFLAGDQRQVPWLIAKALTDR